MVLLNELHHLFIAPTLGTDSGCVLNKLVGAVACFAVAAVHQRIGKASHMA